MRLLSKILKSFAVTIDMDNVVSVDVPDMNNFFIEDDDYEDAPPVLTEEEALSRAEQIIADAAAEADEIKNGAQAQAEDVVAKMRQQAEAEIEELKAAAYDEAAEAGKAEGSKEAAKIIKEAEDIKAQAYVEKNRILNSAEPEIVELIAEIAEKLIGGAFELKPDLILFLVKQGLSATTLAGDIIIHISQDDYNAVISNKNELLAMAEAGCNIEIIKDLSLNAADCIIETKLGNIDCSLDQQYSALKDNLFLILKNRFIEGA